MFTSQLGTLGAGNHYAEIQVVDEIYHKLNASKMGIDEKGQICVMLHCGSRGLGHQVATGAFGMTLLFLSSKHLCLLLATCRDSFDDVPV